MIKTDITVPIGYKAEDIKLALMQSLPISEDEIRDLSILRRRIDLKDKSNIVYKMTVGVALSAEREAGLLKMRKKVFAVDDYTLSVEKASFAVRPIVVGFGPCGMFAALTLAEAGAKPVIIERGLPVDERCRKVDLFKKLSILDPECNVQFGEGGAGTYSDGKLKYGAMDKYKMKILGELVDAGANGEILFSDTAHVGTDKLSDIVKKIREKIISLGGEFIFSAKLVDIEIKNERISSITYIKGGEETILECDEVILAIGHSARDTFKMLEDKKIPMTARGFGIGVRIEHPREYINNLVYGDNAPSGIETASYHLVTHLPSGRSVYSFCMCPGGTVVPAASEEGGIVTNGMSEFLRDGDNSNAAFLVSVTPDDFGSESPLAGFDLQQRIENKAFDLTSSYKAPAISMSDFMEGREPSGIFGVKPSYPIGVEPFKAEDYLPNFVTDSLREAIVDFDNWMPGFNLPDATLTGPETRTTSPVRILRNDGYESVAVRGLYPVGEGAGYSGGIISSAVDGLKCSLALINKHKII